MNDIQRSELIEILNKPKCYSDSLKDWLNKNQISFTKEDNQIFEHVDATQDSILFGEKLNVLFNLLPETDYMYYFNDTDCLLSKVLKNKNYDVVKEMMKEPAEKHGQMLKEETISRPNSFGENVILVTLKNIDSDMDLYESLHIVSDLMRKIDNKDEVWVQKDNNNKDSIDYLFMNVKEDYGVLNAYVFKMIVDLMEDVEQIFEQKNGFKFPKIKPFTSESVIQEEVINVSKRMFVKKEKELLDATLKTESLEHKNTKRL